MKTMITHNIFFQPRRLRFLACLLCCLLLTHSVWPHVIVNELENMPKGRVAFLYLKLGYNHILPQGFDHILFVFSLFLLNPKLKSVLWQASAFTAAHSITLGLAMYQVVTPPSRIVEPLIALSILYVAVENILSGKLKTSRIAVVFLFGLVHGLGFAGALGHLGLPKNDYLVSLVMFNLGVELGQITIILLAFFLIGKWFGDKPYYRKYFVLPASAMIAAFAALLTISRLF